MAFKFQHIDLSSTFGDVREFPPVWDAVSTAILSFRVDLSPSGNGSLRRSYDLSTQKRKEMNRSVLLCLRHTDALIRRFLRAAAEETDGPEVPDGGSIDWVWGSVLVDAMMMNIDLGNPPLAIKTGTQTFNERQMLAAQALRQCERCIDAAKQSNALAVGYLMWDIHELLCEIHHEDDQEELSEAAREKALKLNEKRHASRNQAREMVLKDWETKPNAFPSANKAGKHYAEWLAGKGYEFEPLTVRDWIRAHAKKMGVRFR